MRYVAGYNMPGYLPESEPETFDTFTDAVEYLRDTVERFHDSDHDSLGESESATRWDTVHAALAEASDDDTELGVINGDASLSLWITPDTTPYVPDSLPDGARYVEPSAYGTDPSDIAREDVPSWLESWDYARDGITTRYVLLPVGSGDYVGSVYDAANRRVLAERYPLSDDSALIAIRGAYDYDGMILWLDHDDASEILDTISALSDYPVLDDETVSEIESELLAEACNDWLLSDISREVSRDDITSEMLASAIWEATSDGTLDYPYAETATTIYIPRALWSAVVESFSTIPNHVWYRTHLTGNIVCERCHLLPLDSEDSESECVYPVPSE